MAKVDLLMFGWALLAVVAFGALAAALEAAENRDRNDAAIKSVDALMDCTLYAEEEDSCESEARAVFIGAKP